MLPELLMRVSRQARGKVEGREAVRTCEWDRVSAEHMGTEESLPLLGNGRAQCMTGKSSQCSREETYIHWPT